MPPSIEVNTFKLIEYIYNETVNKLQSVGTTSKLIHNRRNSTDPSHLTKRLVHFSSLLKKCTWVSRLRIRISKDFVIYSPFHY